MSNYKQVSLPSDLIERIKFLIEQHPELGYVSVSDFVKSSVREKLEYLEDKIERRRKIIGD